MTQPISIKANELEAISLASGADETRYYLKGVCFEPYKDGTTGMIATDGHRLHSLYAKRLEDAPKASFILGSDDIKKALSMYKAEAKTMGKHAAQYLTIEITDKTISIIYKKEDDIKTCASFSYTPIDGNFPDWRRVVPGKPDKEFAPFMSFSTKYFADFGTAAKLLTPQKNPQVKIEASGAEQPIIVTLPYNSDFLGVLMPMRA